MVLAEILKLVNAGYTKEEIENMVSDPEPNDPEPNDPEQNDPEPNDPKPNDPKPNPNDHLTVKEYLQKLIDEIQEENRNSSNVSGMKPQTVDDILKEFIEGR